MAHVVQITPSVAISIKGDGPVTLDDLQSFIDQAVAMGVPTNKPLKTALMGAHSYGQREGREPGSFTIQATP